MNLETGGAEFAGTEVAVALLRFDEDAAGGSAGLLPRGVEVEVA